MFKGILAAAAVASGVATVGGLETAAAPAGDEHERRQHVRRTIPIFEGQQASRRSIKNGVPKGPLDIFGGVWYSRYGMLRVDRVKVEVIPEGHRHEFFGASLDEKAQFVTDRVEVGPDGWWRVKRPLLDGKLMLGARLVSQDSLEIKIKETWYPPRNGVVFQENWHEDTDWRYADNFWTETEWLVAFHLAGTRRTPVYVGRPMRASGLVVRHRFGHKRGYSNSCERWWRQTNPVYLYLHGLTNLMNATWASRNTVVDDLDQPPPPDQVTLGSSARQEPPVRWPASFRDAPPNCLP